MSRFDERFWVTVIVLAGVLGFDALVYLVPGHLDSNLLSAILGVLNAQGFLQGVNYWFQTSKSSNDKDDTINTLTKKVGP